MKPIKLFRQEKLPVPPAIRNLLEAELAAGNKIVSTHGAFPAPPIGECYQLARRITTRARSSDDKLKFREINSSLCSGQFSDLENNFFILEPPGPPPPAPDMDAIRLGSNTPRAKTKLEITEEHPYLIALDYKGEMLTYQERDRRTDMDCAFGRKAVLITRSLETWWYPEEKRKSPMTFDERRLVIERLTDYCFREQGATLVELEDWPVLGQTTTMQKSR